MNPQTNSTPNMGGNMGNMGNMNNAGNMGAESDQSVAIRRVVTIGALMVGLGIIILVAQNWANLPAFFKVVILMVSMIATYGIGYALLQYPSLKSVGQGVVFLGALIFGANIFLVAQIYNIQVEWPDGFMIWMFGVFLTLYAVPLKALRVLGVILAILGLGGYVFDFSGTLVGTASYYTSTFIVALSVITMYAAAHIFRKRLPAEPVDFY